MKTVMIVEDESIVAEDIRRSLEHLGYAVSAAVSSGEEAITAAGEKNPDLVLMDIVLRGDMDGIEAAEQLKTQFNIPVVYLTAYADDKKLQRAMITEPYGYILKPFEDRELHTVIEMALYKHKIERKLRENEQWLATTLKSIGDGVIATDTEGQITFMNPVAEALTGWTQEEASGRPLAEIFYIINEETRERCVNPFEKIMETGGIVGLANNTVLVSRNGEERLIADSGAPICSEDHDILGTVLVFRDITERRKMEEDIIRLKTEKMESISVLAGGIAHDFNNILTSILGNITLAKMQTVPEDTLFGMLSKAEKASRRARHLTQQLLMFARDGISVKKPASVTELLQDAVEFALQGSKSECEFCLSDHLWSVDMDEGQISQVINNVIINADQAMPTGGVISIHAENVAVRGEGALPLKDGNYVKISIEDQGIGIPQEHLQKIFNPYFTTKNKGSGLGLAISHSIIKNHDGCIAVASEPGVGTTFSMWLPASEKEVEPEREQDMPIGGGGRVLVMDDDESILEVTRDVLDHLGYEIEFARNGSDAIEQYRTAFRTGVPFDVVILDLTVRGGLGGRETIQKLAEVNPDVKAIISSGYSTDPVVNNYRKYGFSGAITKPYSIKELSKVLRDVMGI
jgi:two-component system cell cycle sensor histidine kinase/response regulator CckA